VPQRNHKPVIEDYRYTVSIITDLSGGMSDIKSIWAIHRNLFKSALQRPRFKLKLEARCAAQKTVARGG